MLLDSLYAERDEDEGHLRRSSSEIDDHGMRRKLSMMTMMMNSLVTALRTLGREDDDDDDDYDNDDGNDDELQAHWSPL